MASLNFANQEDQEIKEMSEGPCQDEDKSKNQQIKAEDNDGEDKVYPQGMTLKPVPHASGPKVTFAREEKKFNPEEGAFGPFEEVDLKSTLRDEDRSLELLHIISNRLDLSEWTNLSFNQNVTLWMNIAGPLAELYPWPRSQFNPRILFGLQSRLTISEENLEAIRQFQSRIFLVVERITRIIRKTSNFYVLWIVEAVLHQLETTLQEGQGIPDETDLVLLVTERILKRIDTLLSKSLETTIDIPDTVVSLEANSVALLFALFRRRISMGAICTMAFIAIGLLVLLVLWLVGFSQ